MKDKWYNKELQIKYVFVILAVIFIGTLFLPVQDIECSKINNTCSIYSRSVIFRQPKLVNQFNISDIERYEIKDIRHGGGGRGGHSYTSYSIDIYLNSGKVVYIENETQSYQRAQEIYNSMINGDFTLKGNYWNSILNNY